ncbi:AzlD family protein [Dictyobacter formicarum]|uniref:Branched-chain amino acid ABC transporter n=1 Tax=Dictyobacter formicarum TaxID=2778368 RepID=A0ABQ3VLI1_9CHLR|nr:AzlD domain-containing protein [Dictyobacter formicarum]GHO86950.1 hypothetical protein KSZ_49560 [Dictyobacter formicarum]
MQTSPIALLTILGMAVVTYLTRIAGVWFMSRVELSGWLKAWVNALPGTILVAIIAPTIFNAGAPEIGAALATVLTFARTRNVLLSITIGVGVVVGLRALLAHLA